MTDSPPIVPTRRITAPGAAQAATPAPSALDVRLWLNESWYIPVDHQGYVAGECFEGAFGCVIEVYNHDEHNKRRLALKVPRLLADTTRENAYIWQMQVEERRVAEDVNQKRAQDDAILRTEPLNNILQRPRQLIIGDEPAESVPGDGSTGVDVDFRDQHGGVLFINYTKGQKPRLANIRLVRSEARNWTMTVTPSSLKPTFAALAASPSIWEALQRPPKAGGAGPRFSTPCFVEINPDKAAAHLTFGPLDKVLELRNASEVWFCGLDSVVYEWANGTLQEALERGYTRDWRLVQVYEVMQQVLKGLVTLHSQEYVHADIRPANIIAIGDLTNPASFCVGDYGSFSRFSYEPNETPSGGYTLVGAGPGKFRSSVFYSPERRGGIERETANVAVLLKQGEGLRVILGWNSDLRHLPREQLIERVSRAVEISTSDRTRDEMLTKGDRIRIRDYIFDIIAEPKQAEPGSKEQFIVYECAAKFATVMHERMAILNQEEKLPEFSLVTLPSYLEIRQWSCATDIYGVGTIALYCLYRNQAALDSKDQGLTDVGDSANNWVTSSHQAEFAELVETLENRANADQLWPVLERFRISLEGEGGDTSVTQEIPSDLVEVVKNAGNGALVVANPSATSLASAEGSSPSSRVDGAVEIARSLFNAHPAMHRILDFFSSQRILSVEDAPANWPGPDRYNVAYFLLFVHFVMSCLHHRSYLKVPEGAKYPFCSHRRERTPPGFRDKRAKEDPTFPALQKGLPSAKALARLKRLKQYCKGGHWSDYWIDRTVLVGTSVERGHAVNIIDLWSKHEAYKLEAKEARVRNSALKRILGELDSCIAEKRGQKPGLLGLGKAYDELFREVSQQLSNLRKAMHGASGGGATDKRTDG